MIVHNQEFSCFLRKYRRCMLLSEAFPLPEITFNSSFCPSESHGLVKTSVRYKVEIANFSSMPSPFFSAEAESIELQAKAHAVKYFLTKPTCHYHYSPKVSHPLSKPLITVRNPLKYCGTWHWKSQYSELFSRMTAQILNRFIRTCYAKRGHCYKNCRQFTVAPPT